MTETLAADAEATLEHKLSFYPKDILPAEEATLLADSPWLDTETHVLVDTQADPLQYVVVFDRTLGGMEFINFMNEVAPSEIRMSDYSILADWDLPERLPEGVLMSLHTTVDTKDEAVPTDEREPHAIGRAFAEFVQTSRAPFIRATMHVTREHNLTDANLISKDTLVSQVMNLFYNYIGTEEVDHIAERLQLPAFKARALHILAHHPDFARRRSSSRNPEEWAEKVFMTINPTSHSRIKKDLYRLYRKSLSLEESDLLLNHLTDDLVSPLPDEFGKNAEKYFVKRSALPARPTRKVIDSKTGATQEFILGRTPRCDRRGRIIGWREVEIPVPGSLEQDRYNLRPALRVKLSENGHVFISDETHEPAKRNEATQVRTDDSSLLGLLVLSHLYPSLRTNTHIWPRTMRLPGSKVNQSMSAVQVPVLALMRRNRILSHPLIDEIEKAIA